MVLILIVFARNATGDPPLLLGAQCWLLLRRFVLVAVYCFLFDEPERRQVCVRSASCIVPSYVVLPHTAFARCLDLSFNPCTLLAILCCCVALHASVPSRCMSLTSRYSLRVRKQTGLAVCCAAFLAVSLAVHFHRLRLDHALECASLLVLALLWAPSRSDYLQASCPHP
jgi:hypothetical protein